MEEEQSGQQGSWSNQTAALLLYPLCWDYFNFLNPLLLLLMIWPTAFHFPCDYLV